MSSIISDAQRVRANQAKKRKLGYKIDHMNDYRRAGTSFSGAGTISSEKLEEMVKKSKFFQSESNW